MTTFNTYGIKEAQDNLARIKAELRADNAKYWALQERLYGVYDGDTDAQYADMMKQFSALSAINCGHDLIKSIKADIKNMETEDAWFIAHYDAKKAMQERADTMGALIIDDKNTKFHNEHHFIVLAKYRHDFVTWVWANGGFHNGHYYRYDAKGAQADFIKRGE